MGQDPWTRTVQAKQSVGIRVLDRLKIASRIQGPGHRQLSQDRKD